MREGGEGADLPSMQVGVLAVEALWLRHVAEGSREGGLLRGLKRAEAAEHLGALPLQLGKDAITGIRVAVVVVPPAEVQVF